MSSRTQEPGEQAAVSSIRLLSYWFAVCAALTVIVAMMFLKPVLGGNDGSRWNTVWSLTHDKGYVIDEAPYGTVDKVKRDGHFYSSKPPLYPTLIAGIVWGIRALTGLDLPQDGKIIIRLVLVLVNVIPLSLLVVFYGRILERQKVAYRTSVICLVAATWGTYMTSYSVTLNNHTPAAIGCFFTLYHLVRIIYEKKSEWWRYASCGLVAAWTVCSELPAAPFGLIVFIWLFKNDWKSTSKYFTPPAMILFSGYFLTTWFSTGSFVPNYVRFNSPLYFYEGSYWTKPSGIDAANDPKWFYFFNLTLGHHGLFSLTPIFLVSFYGFFRNNEWRGIYRLGFFLVIGLLLLYLVKSNNYGGWCHGPRWFMWVIPFFLISLGPAVQAIVTRRRLLCCLYLCLGLSVFCAISAMVSSRGPWGISWIQKLMHSFGWIEY